jgi:hypothetical protein
MIQRAMAKHPDDRYPSSAALREVLLPFMELRALPGGAPRTLPGPASSTHPTQPAITPFEAAARAAPVASASSGSVLVLPQRRWPIALSAGGVVAAVLCAMIWGTGGLNAARRPPPPPPKAVAGAPAVVLPESTALTDLRPEPATRAEPGRPEPTLRPTSKKPQSSSKSGVAPTPLSEPAPVTPAGEASSQEEPAPAAAAPQVRSGDATYHFPNRTLKDVF